MTALTKAGKQVRVQEEIGKQATAGEQALVDLIKENLPSFRLPNIFSIAATTTNKALDAVEKKLGKATMNTLTEAARTAKSFEDLLKVLPANERNRVLKTLSNAQTWQVLPKGTQGAAIIGATEATKNALAEEQQNVNALAR
jgi:glutamyl-tRNA reductase